LSISKPAWPVETAGDRCESQHLKAQSQSTHLLLAV
jgi:hypothetical protein